MMKKLLFLVLLLPCITIAQNTAHIGVSGGYAVNGFAMLVNYNHPLSEVSYLQGGVYVSFSKDTQTDFEIPYSDFTVNLGYYHDVYQSNLRSFKISIGGGAVGGYELVNNGDDQLDNGAFINSESKLIYGAFVGAELDFVLNEEISIYVTTNEYYHVNSDLGSFAFYGGIGLKYYLF